MILFGKNAEWIAKSASITERDAMLSLRGVLGMIPLGGIFTVLTGNKQGYIILFTKYGGNQVQDIHIKRICIAIQATIRLIHAAGWHHHDIHERNVIEDDTGKVSLIDFGRAVRVEECSNPGCEDSIFLKDSDDAASEEVEDNDDAEL
ncbi:hypothetical protein C0993_001257 [Termitomyces sp. T159_Od127]|nr:hypothetical protein C0993_001257 [Termitomyces sp. T159_Od127]